MVEFELHKIVISENRADQVITLREKNGEREFPIIIGIFEAIAIDRKLRDEKVPRPLTHDLVCSVIERMGGVIKKISINAYSQGTYYATVVIDAHGNEINVDSRPSDAIAIAVRSKSPLFVSEDVLAVIFPS